MDSELCQGFSGTRLRFPALVSRMLKLQFLVNGRTVPKLEEGFIWQQIIHGLIEQQVESVLDSSSFVLV